MRPYRCPPPSCWKVWAIVDAPIGGGTKAKHSPSARSAAFVKQRHQLSPVRLNAVFGREPFTPLIDRQGVQSIAKRCVATIDEDFEDEGSWSDLLMVLEPCRVSRSTIETWRNKAQKGLAALRDEPDDELEFHELYYANLDKIFAVLLKRFT